MAYHQVSDVETSHPLLVGKTPVNPKAALYICKNFACDAPITDAGKQVPLSYTAIFSKCGTNHSSNWWNTRAKPPTTYGLPVHATPQGTGTYVANYLGKCSNSAPVFAWLFLVRFDGIDDVSNRLWRLSNQSGGRRPPQRARKSASKRAAISLIPQQIMLMAKANDWWERSSKTSSPNDSSHGKIS